LATKETPHEEKKGFPLREQEDALCKGRQEGGVRQTSPEGEGGGTIKGMRTRSVILVGGGSLSQTAWGAGKGRRASGRASSISEGKKAHALNTGRGSGVAGLWESP